MEALAEQYRDRDPVVIGLAQNFASALATEPRKMGDGALRLFCTLTRAGGARTFKAGGLDEQAAELTGVLLEQLGLKPVALSPSQSRASAAAELFCALGRLGNRDQAVNSLLCSYLAEHMDEVDIDQLPQVARAATVGDSSEEFVLLHSLCRRSATSIASLDGPSVVSMLQIFARHELYDEEFLEAATCHLMASAATLAVPQLGDAMYALGSLQVREPALLDPLCDALRPKAGEVTEADLVRFMKGLVKLRHCNEALLQAFQPVIDRIRLQMHTVSLGNVISTLAFFGTAPESFFKRLLSAATQRLDRLTPTTVQHVLTALCRLHGRLQREAMIQPLGKLCKLLSDPSISPRLTPVQAVGSLTALAKLQYRDLQALAVLTSVLAGRAESLEWSWAPSAFFYAHRPLPARPFDEARVQESVLNVLEPSHRIEVLQSLNWLGAHSGLTGRLSLLLCSTLLPKLHELRAREVLVVARALAASQLPCAIELPGQAEESLFASPSTSDASGGEAGNAAVEAQSWRERLVDLCLENLRRHEFFLESNWHNLLPLKLLCLEIDVGTYGSRRLDEFLSPMLLSFVERLRSLTFAECEANRHRQEGAENEEEAGAAPAAGKEEPKASSSATEALDEADDADGLVFDCGTHRVTVHGYVRDLPVDLLIEAAG